MHSGAALLVSGIVYSFGRLSGSALAPRFGSVGAAQCSSQRQRKTVQPARGARGFRQMRALMPRDAAKGNVATLRSQCEVRAGSGRCERRCWSLLLRAFAEEHNVSLCSQSEVCAVSGRCGRDCKELLQRGTVRACSAGEKCARFWPGVSAFVELCSKYLGAGSRH